jgi:ankyrin repeat protein
MDLIDAIIQHDINTVKNLLQQGANPNLCEDKANLTPLHFAVIYRSPGIIPLLLAAGADPNIQNEDGFTPLDLVRDMIDAHALACIYYDLNSKKAIKLIYYI